MANTTWNPSDKGSANIVLSGGNLIATTNVINVNAGLRSVDSQPAGTKFYFEVTLTTSSNQLTGIATSAAGIALGNNWTNAAVVNASTGQIWVNNVNSGIGVGAFSAGQVACAAVDLSAQLIWFRNGAAGNWNGNAGNNPATGTGGRSISFLGSSSVYAYAAFNTSANGSGFNANFGDSAFVGVVPAGFTAGFSTGAAIPPPAVDLSLPAWDVPTPTGTLQGVAVASWDGSVWQPAGRCMASVATPTGVLRGVAPFSWDGAAWQPAGRAGPGVPTPTGTLDGVAVYSWNGSAWAPAGGGTTPTPSGTLQGVAAFTWDGTAWQPAGRAAPEVPTPYGVLAGVALFNWTGSAWTPAPSVDLNFLTMATLDPRVTFTRASVATYFDANGVLQTAGSNVPRFDYDPVSHAPRGLLIEEGRTNLLLNSATLATQDVAVTAQPYVLSFYGTGTVTMSGAFTGQLTGTGPFPARVQGAFTPTAGTVTLTVTGTVQNAQLEADPFASSYIPTAGATASRAVEIARLPSIPGRNTAAESYNAEFVLLANPGLNPRVVGGVGLPFGMVYVDGGQHGGTYDTVALANTANQLTLGALSKIASSWTSPTGSVCLNGGAVASASMTTGFAGTSGCQFMGDGIPGDVANGYMRRFRYWPRVLSNTEMQQVTT